VTGGSGSWTQKAHSVGLDPLAALTPMRGRLLGSPLRNALQRSSATPQPSAPPRVAIQIPIASCRRWLSSKPPAVSSLEGYQTPTAAGNDRLAPSSPHPACHLPPPPRGGRHLITLNRTGRRSRADDGIRSAGAGLGRNPRRVRAEGQSPTCSSELGAAVRNHGHRKPARLLVCAAVPLGVWPLPSERLRSIQW